ncbi:MAG: DUF327 family protein [Treponema sp.]|nr:DUF327 family protein [Treponema sp.]
MAGELDGISGNALYYASLQNAGINQLKNQKTEKTKDTGNIRKSRFSEALKKKEAETELEAKGLPPEIQNMSLDEAAIYLKDAVDLAGNELSSKLSMENLGKFKKAIRQFLMFVEENNFTANITVDRRVQIARKLNRIEPTNPPVHVFSTYNNVPRTIPPSVTISVINEKLDQITRDMLQTQSDNLKILNNINELKGLVVDLLHS